MLRVGDEVVCIWKGEKLPGDSWAGHLWAKLVLRPGGTYVVSWVGVGSVSGTPTLRLVGVRNRPGKVWAQGLFRKVQRRDLTAWLATENTIEGPTRAPAKKRVRA